MNSTNIRTSRRDHLEPGGIHRIVIASPGGTVGGGGTGAMSREISEWLVANDIGISVTVLDTRGVGSVLLWPFYFSIAASRLIWLRLTSKPEILHVQVTERGSFVRKGLLLRLGRALGMCCVLHHHGAELIPYFRGASRFVRCWITNTVRAADLNIVLGERIRGFLINEVGVAPEALAVLHNAARDFGTAPSRRSISKASAHYLLVANLSPRKGVSEFLHAVKQLASEGRHIRATLAGGEDVSRYTREAENLGLASLCTFTGWINRSQVEALLHTADALVLPSYDEGLPMVILEALSAGVPVIATPVGSIPEVLTHGKDCLLVTPGDRTALATAMKLVTDDEMLRRRLISEGRHVYESRFQMGAYMHNLIALYEKALTMAVTK